MTNSASALRRWLGMFSLAVASGMLIWGQTILRPILQGVWFVCYWLVFLAFNCGAVAISLLDFFAIRRSLVQDIDRLRSKANAEAGPTPPPSRQDADTGTAQARDSTRQNPSARPPIQHGP